MALSKERIEEIECITWDLLTETFRTANDMHPPINLNILLRKAGINLKQGTFGDQDISGAYNRSEKVIYINKNDSFVRKTFTIAHELGHHYLHENTVAKEFFRKDMFSIEKEHKIEEQEANWFAASLLMPKSFIKELWKATNDTQAIAAIFGVSSTAVYYRLKNLGLLPQLRGDFAQR
ncbi:MAG: ImmA/IrrE family metallo-endopeptidase [Chlamydiota bacterium]|nr:ImmA/IrrE family metallo-endopeptidase [Chlamydiota bacterium]